MWMIPHTLVGITLAAKIENPLVSLPLALLSHYLVDFIPHWTQTPTFFGKKSIALYVDFIISLSLGIFFALKFPLWSNEFWIVILGAALGNFLDAIRIPALLLRRDFPSTQNHTLISIAEKIHAKLDQDVKHEKEKLVFKFTQGSVYIGIGTQILTIVLCLWILLT